jgi:hypothetical protein
MTIKKLTEKENKHLIKGGLREGAIWEKAYNGNVNFVTPFFEKFYYRQDKGSCMVIELSSGKGFMRNDDIYGITVVTYNWEKGEIKLEQDKSKMCESLKEAKEYIRELLEISLETVL